MLQATGQIKLSEILAEYGLAQSTKGISLFYRGGSNVIEAPVNANVPTSGQVKFSNLYGSVSYFVYTKTFSANERNYVLTTDASSAGWDGVKPIKGSVTVGSGIVVGSNGAGGVTWGSNGWNNPVLTSPTYAFDTGTLPSYSIVSIVNNGYIVGAGGQGGGNGAEGNHADGYPGGPAIIARSPVTLTNNGIIGGGGGGGGGGDGNGGSAPNGGGGAGDTVGPAGVGGWGDSPNYPGSLLSGGTGRYPPWGGTGGALGATGQTYDGSGLGGSAGNAITGTANITYSVYGDVRGPVV